jgi:predicted glycogen debranching enzyme
VRFCLEPGQSVHFACSTEPIDLPRLTEAAEHETEAKPYAPVSAPADLKSDETFALLTRAADQFVVPLSGGVAVLTNLPWSPPSVRDALIAFNGLFLLTGRFKEARALLQWCGAALSGGLIPTELPEDGTAPRYTGADTSLWFVNAMHQYVRYSRDDASLRSGLFEVCAKIVERYRNGSAGLGIACDSDGLISSRVPGLPTTWMDAKLGDWVVTPRHGAPVEVNALWYNALRIVARWCDELDQPSRGDELTALADRVKIAFNLRFWQLSVDCCYDVLGDRGVADASIRPNQLLAISLTHPVLNVERFESVLGMVEDQLLTPFGVRTLAPGDPSYQGSYCGDVVSRDRAYHQGSAYPWLLGPYVSALLRVHGRSGESRHRARQILEPCLSRMRNGGLGQLCELFDGAGSPQRAGGGIASARSVGELLRAYVEDVLNVTPETQPCDGRSTGGRPRARR